MPTAGVDDNGSGVSVLLELAHRFYDMDTPCTLQFVFFDTEEYGAYAGSSCFVYTYLMTNNLLDDVLCCINIDSIAGGDRLYGYGGEYDEDGKLTREWVYDEANLIADDLGLDLYTLQNKLLSFSLRQDFLEVTATILPRRAFLTFIWKQVFGAMMTEQAAMMKHI